ncbi:MAG: hypothetical protein K2H23_04740, partial [Oscillospiraceae bacterium]|nr:hypothetical protein [Oscillospiraceae bacterium]
VMSDNFISSLKQIFEFSGIAVTITDENLDVIWRNKLSKPISRKSRDNLSSVFGEGAPKTGIVHKTVDGIVYSFNVMKTEDASDKKVYYVIEIVRTEKLENIISSPVVREFISFICVRIRETLGNITFFSDDIFNEISIGCPDFKGITDDLNRIDKNIMMLAKEIVNPEQLYVLLDSDGSEVTLSLDDEMRKIVSDAKKVFGRKIRVSEDYDENIYFRMERSTFETVIAGMTEECCGGELFPERFIFSAKRTAADRAEISVMSINTSGAKNDRYETSVRDNLESMNIDHRMFFEYICEVLRKKCGAVFTKKAVSDGLLFTMEFNVIPSGVLSIAMNRPLYNVSNERFSTMAMMLAYFHTGERYYYVPTEVIDDAIEEEQERRKENQK